jgi:hypothetical protein
MVEGVGVPDRCRMDGLSCSLGSKWHSQGRCLAQWWGRFVYPDRSRAANSLGGEQCREMRRVVVISIRCLFLVW